MWDIKTSIQIYTIALLIMGLNACGKPETPTSNQAPKATPFKYVAVRVNSITNQADFAPVDQEIPFDKDHAGQINQQLPWQPLDPSQTISEKRGYPEQPDRQWYFVQNPGLNNYMYPNYYGANGYPYNHYYPQSGYYNWGYYQPIYYYNRGYYYCQPTNYFPYYWGNTLYSYYYYNNWWW